MLGIGFFSWVVVYLLPSLFSNFCLVFASSVAPACSPLAIVELVDSPLDNFLIQFGVADTQPISWM